MRNVYRVQAKVFMALLKNNEIEADLWLQNLIRKNQDKAAQYIGIGHSIARLSGQILIDLCKDASK